MPLWGWIHNEEEALQVAAQSGKPLLLAYRVESSPWSQKFYSDILSQPEFVRLVQDDFVLADVQKGELPEFVLFSASGETIAKVGYLPLSPQEFAAHLKEIFSHHRQIKCIIESGALKSFTEEELKELYGWAQELSSLEPSSRCYQEQILEAGLRLNEGVFFLTEKYAALIQKSVVDREQLAALKAKILQKDPDNAQGAKLSLALLDFQAMASGYRKRHNPHAVIKPLVSFLEQHGNRDPETGWKVQVMIARFLWNKGKVAEALDYAVAASSLAPEHAQAEIAEIIKDLSSTR